MSSSINATTTNGILLNSDNSGILQLQSGGTTIATISSTGLQQNVGAPAFSAYVSTGQSISNATNTIAAFQTKDFDTGGCYNNTSSTVTLNGLSVPAYSFCPNIAGYYQVSASARIPGTPNSESIISIQKNNSEWMRGLNYVGITTFSYTPFVASGIIYLNGSGDYTNIMLYQGSGSTQTTSAVSVFKFQAAMIRSA